MALRLVNLNITSKCNMKCQHCGATINNGPDLLSLQVIKQLVSDMTRIGCYELVIAGGEPFQRNDFMEILKICNENRVNTAVLTNGTLLNKTIIEELGELPHLTYVRMSMDYLGEKLDKFRGLNGAFEKITENIRLLKEQKITVGINMTINPYNMNEMKEMLEYSIKEKVNFVRFAPLELLGKATNENIDEAFYIELLDRIINLMADYFEYLELDQVTLPSTLDEYIRYFLVPCAGGIISMSVDSDGEVTICPMYQKEMNINVTKMEMKDIWKNIEKSSNSARQVKKEGRCFACGEEKTCAGGCLAAKYSRGLSEEAEQPICYKYILKNVLEKYYTNEHYRPLLSGILHRQLLFLKYNIVPCYRSFPFWMYPLKQKDEWGIL